MDKRTLAIDCYIQALQKSVYLTEALDALMQHEMLMAWEEKDLIQHIMPAQQQGNEADLQILKHLYESKLKKYYTAQNQVSQEKINLIKCLIKDLFLVQSSREDAQQYAIDQHHQ